MIELLCLLLAAHFLCDYPLQGTWIATTKSHRQPHPSGYPWYHSLTAHASIHGAAVGLVTGSLLLGWLELIAHWLIDYSKNSDRFGVNLDQFLHITCKGIWILMLMNNIS